MSLRLAICGGLNMQPIFWVTAFLFFCSFPITLSAGKSDTVHSLHREIVLLNLVNGLQLTPEQSEQLLRVVCHAQQLREEYEHQIKQGGMEEAWQALHLQLIHQDLPSPEVARKAHQAAQFEKQSRFALDDHLITLANEVRKILTPNQIYLAEKFKPCLIPPKQGAIGQMPGEGFQHLEKVLERIRSLPEDRVDVATERLFNRYLEKLEEHEGILTDAEKNVERAKIDKIVTEARRLSDLEFQLRLPELTTAIAERQVSTPRPKKHELDNLGKFLLDEKLIPILESRVSSPGRVFSGAEISERVPSAGSK